MDPKQLNFYRSLLAEVACRIENPYKANAAYLRKLADEVLPALCGTSPIYQVWDGAEYVNVTPERYASCLPAARRIVYGERVEGRPDERAATLPREQIERIARECEIEAHACLGTTMYMCAEMAIEAALEALSSRASHDDLQLAEVCEDADGTKHIEAVVEDLDDIPAGTKLYARAAQQAGILTHDAREVVAWMIDWPDEPELGHSFSEDPDPTGRSIPLSRHLESQIPKGWQLYSADFSISPGYVMLIRDDAGKKWWHSLPEEQREKAALFITGRGNTLLKAIDAARAKEKP